MRRADHIFVVMLATLALSPLLAEPVRADGVQPPCTGRRLDRSDREASRQAIINAAGAHGILWPTQKVCSWRNGNTKHRTAQVDLQTEVLPDGSILQRTLRCHDDFPQWKCEEFSGRELKTRLLLAGAERRIRLWLPNGFDSRAVNTLLMRAFALAPQQSVAENCAADKRPPAAREQELLPLFKQSFGLDGDDWYLQIREWTGSVEVHAGDFFLEFSRSGETPEKFEYRCWDLDEPIRAI